MKTILFVGLIAIIGTSAIHAADDAPSTASVESTALRYTFSYPYTDADDMKPRGGTTRGTKVTLDDRASAAWTALRAADISDHERDRRAILAMAGEYRVSFDFIEVVRFDAKAPKDRPYQSWATEKVYVVADRPDFVSLQHILVMQMPSEDGKPSAPFVTKHWRQDWRYQPDHIDRYLGPIRWQRSEVSKAESAGRWSQTAYQVDDSPRYAALGRWQHNTSFSTWLGDETLRPLPRREYSFRSDYQTLVASNRHTVLPTGWVQEENNLKAVVAVGGNDEDKSASALPYVGREYGIARYERISDFDFSAGDAYWKRTGPLWSHVRAHWDALFADNTPVCLRAAPDQKQLFMPLFELAGDDAKLAKASDQELRTWSADLIDGYLSADAGSKACRGGEANSAKPAY